MMQGAFTDLLQASATPPPSAEPEPLLQLMEELLAELKPPEAEPVIAVLAPEPNPQQEAPGTSLLSLAGIVEALGDVAGAPVAEPSAEPQPPTAVETDSSEPDFPSEFEISSPEPEAQHDSRSLTLDADDDPTASLLPGFAGKPSAISGMLEELLEESVQEPEPLPALAISPEPTELTALIESMEREVVGQAPAAEPEPEQSEAVEIRQPQVQESCIVFGLDGTRYAVPMKNVTEIDTIPRITPVPHTPEFVRGVTNRRGEVVCVLDLRALLGMEPAPPQPRQRILVMRTARELSAAMVVDEVRGTTALPLQSLPGPMGPVNDRVAELLAGVSQHQEQILNVLDVEKLFATPEMRQLTSAGESAR